MKQAKTPSICPISGLPKRRRHAVAARVWDNMSLEEKKLWAANANKGSLRQYSVRKQGGNRTV